MTKCTCSRPAGLIYSEDTGYGVKLLEDVRMYMPGCPVHQAPLVDEDQYTLFDTPQTMPSAPS